MDQQRARLLVVEEGRPAITRRQLALRVTAVVVLVASVSVVLLAVTRRSQKPAGQPLVSIVVVTHERPHFLRHALESIRMQGTPRGAGRGWTGCGVSGPAMCRDVAGNLASPPGAARC